jgi:hypothetical protein
MSVCGVSPGSTREEPAGSVTEPPNSSLAVKRFRISAAAALNPLWPEMYSGKGGVIKVKAGRAANPRR